MIKDFEFKNKDLNIYKNEIKDFIPDEIIDNHIHIWQKNNIKIEKKDYKKYKSYKPWTDFDFINEFTYEDFFTYTNIIFPGKKYTGIFFGAPFETMDINKTNQYVINCARKNNLFFLYIPSPTEDIFLTDKKLALTQDKKFLGFKPYPDLAGIENNEISIFEFLNENVLKCANENNLMIILHIPRKQKLNDERNIAEIDIILKKYKNIKLILAHSGRSFCFSDIENNIDKIKHYENIFFDIAFINEYRVFELLVKKVDISKIIYGSDSPLALIKGKDVCINKKHYYVTNKLYEWGLGPLNQDLTDFTLFIYEEIISLLDSIKKIKPRKLDTYVSKIFYNNFKNLII